MIVWMILYELYELLDVDFVLFGEIVIVVFL